MIISNFPGNGKNPLAIPDFSYTGKYALDADDDGWKIRFLTSGILTLLSEDVDVDVFIVGGGGGGGGGSSDYTSGNNGVPYYTTYGSGGGGGGGYTKTVKGKILTAGQAYEIIVGAGGLGRSAAETTAFTGDAGGESSFDGETAAGGNGGYCAGYKYGDTSSNCHKGGAGGSGGGGGISNKRGNGGAGGSDGSDGDTGTAFADGAACAGGTGQGTTTAEFGEEGATLYAGGGGGGQAYYDQNGGGTYAWDLVGASGGEGGGGTGAVECIRTPGDGEPNTGGGGGGGVGGWSNGVQGPGGNGGSGIIIIRNARR